MSSTDHRKNRIIATIACLIVLLIFPDVIFDFLVDFFHFLFELLFELADISFELIETVLDKLVEHIFHTDLHETQTIVFYIMLISGIYLGYKLFGKLVPFTRQCVNSVVETYHDYLNYLLDSWRQLDLANKIKWIALSAAGLYVLFLVSF